MRDDNVDRDFYQQLQGRRLTTAEVLYYMPAHPALLQSFLWQTMDEAPSHPHNAARETFVEVEGVVQPAPAPRFSATPGAIQGPPPRIGAHNDAALADWGFSAAAIDALKASGAL